MKCQKTSRDPIFATIAAHQKAAAALMVALKRKLRLEDISAAKPVTATIRMDRSGKSCRRGLARDAGRFNGASTEVAKLPQHSAFFARPPSDTR